MKTMSESADWLNDIVQQIRLRLLFIWWDSNHLDAWLPPDTCCRTGWSLHGPSEGYSVLWQRNLHKQHVLFHAGRAVPFTRGKHTTGKEKSHLPKLKKEKKKKKKNFGGILFVCDLLALADNSVFQWTLILVSCAFFNEVFESKTGNAHKKCFSLSIWVTFWECKIEL